MLRFRKILILAYYYLFIQVGTFATDYCKICVDRSHTMCKYTQRSEHCINYKKSKITRQIQKEIVNLHNSLRNKVALGHEHRGNPGPQPSASNMLSMKWDEELAEIAQRFADQCFSYKQKNLHDDCKKTDRFAFGQNIISTVHKYDQPPDFNYMINFWFSQVEYFDKSKVDKFDSMSNGQEVTGHYAQIVWATTQNVGCGHASFFENSTIHGSLPIPHLIHRFVCNYGPTGNVYGFSVYKKGPSCSKCPKEGCDQKYKGLCRDFEYKFSKTALEKTTGASLIRSLTKQKACCKKYIILKKGILWKNNRNYDLRSGVFGSYFRVLNIHTYVLIICVIWKIGIFLAI